MRVTRTEAKQLQKYSSFYQRKLSEYLNEHTEPRISARSFGYMTHKATQATVKKIRRRSLHG